MTKVSKKVIFFGIIFIVLCTIGILYYYSEYNTLNREGVHVDWDDPWAFDGEVLYFTEYKRNDGKIERKWLTKDKAIYVTERIKRHMEVMLP